LDLNKDTVCLLEKCEPGNAADGLEQGSEAW
jgi:hypothetical protein